MCGGVLEQVMCSHVGHIFRSRSPYAWRSGTDILRKNSVRVAEVWLDDYKKYYYERLNFHLVRTSSLSKIGTWSHYFSGHTDMLLAAKYSSDHHFLLLCIWMQKDLTLADVYIRQ